MPFPTKPALLATALTVSTVVSWSAEQAPSSVKSPAQGQTLFYQQCAGCHALATDAIGPPLGGVTKLLSTSQLVEWIRNPAQVLATGDARANALFRRYKVPMPPFAHLTDAEITAILAYVEQESVARGLSAVPTEAIAGTGAGPRLLPPVEKTDLVIELEDVVEIPRVTGRTPYQALTLVRPDPREDGALLVLDLMGLIHRVAPDRTLSVFLDVRGLFPELVTAPGVATGFGSFALHPEFPSNGIVYTSHSERFRGSPVINADDIPADVPPFETPPLEWVLTEWRLPAGTHREVMRFVTPTTGHNWQEIAFAPVTDRGDPDYGLLYIGCGDGGAINLKRPDMAGHPHTLLGAILRIDPAGTNGIGGGYGIPPDNPFATSEDPALHREIWAYGFRNPHRFSWHVAGGRRTMIAIDIGESNIEEVNLIEPGHAYGWGARGIEGTFFIDPKVDAKIVRPATSAELADIHLPFAAYDHADGPAITGGYVYRGPLAALRDKYIFGDIVNGRLFYLDVSNGFTNSTIYELNVARDGAATSLKELAHAARAHLRLGYDDRTGDLYVTTKDDGMIRRIAAAYVRSK